MRSQRGFSLVEVLFAFMILMLVITISLAAFLERNRRLQQASEIILAYQSLANEAEFRRRMAFSSLEGQPVEFVSNTDVLAPLAPFETVVAVTPGKSGIKNVLMTIRWRDGARSARLELVRADTGSVSGDGSFF